MAIQTPVSPNVKTPGFYLRLNLLGAEVSSGEEPLDVLLLSQKNTADGDITPDTEIRQVFGPDDVGISHGTGSQGHVTAQALFTSYPGASVYVGAPVAPAGTAREQSYIITGTATENTVVRYVISGRIFDVAWLIGEDDSAFRTRLIDEVNGSTDELTCIAAAGVPAGQTLFTAKSVGVWGDDIVFQAPVIIRGGGGITIGAAANTPGVGEADYSNILDLAKTTEYTVILPTLSNADASTTGATSNATRVKVHIETYYEGLDALLQCSCIGHTGSIADVKQGTLDRNFEYMWYAYGKDFQSLPCELAGAEVGEALKGWNNFRPNYNRIGNAYATALLFGPADPVGDKLTPNQTEDLFRNGVTVIGLQGNNAVPFLVRPVTTYSKTNGNPDFRAFDLGDVFGAIEVARDMRTAVPIEFANAGISEDLSPNDPPLPEGIAERRDVQAYIESRVSNIHVPNGVVSGPAFSQAVEDGSVIVEINAQDDTQVDFFLPIEIIKPLAKFGGTVTKVN